jgi:hypothetical protein
LSCFSALGFFLSALCGTLATEHQQSELDSVLADQLGRKREAVGLAAVRQSLLGVVEVTVSSLAWSQGVCQSL